MPFAEWPDALPQEMLLDHGAGPEVNTVEFRPQVGAPTLYQVGDARSFVVRGRLRMTDAQLETFLEFYRETLHNGSRRFNWTSSSFDGATMRLQFDAANPFGYSASAVGWMVDVSLTVVRQVA